MTVTQAIIDDLLQAINPCETRPQDARPNYRNWGAVKNVLTNIVESLAESNLLVTATHIPFGDSDNTLTTEAELTYTVGTNTLYVGTAIRFGGDDTDHQLANTASGSGSTSLFYGDREVIRASATPPTVSYSADDESGVYTGIDNAQAGTVYATVADVNALRTAYENLRAYVESIGTELDTIGVIQ